MISKFHLSLVFVLGQGSIEDGFKLGRTGRSTSWGHGAMREASDVVSERARARAGTFCSRLSRGGVAISLDLSDSARLILSRDTDI